MEIARLLLRDAVSDKQIFETLDCCLAERLINFAEAAALADPLGIEYTPHD